MSANNPANELEAVLRAAERGITTQLKIMRRPDPYGVSNEGVAYHVLVGMALALNAAAQDVSDTVNKTERENRLPKSENSEGLTIKSG